MRNFLWNKKQFTIHTITHYHMIMIQLMCFYVVPKVGFWVVMASEEYWVVPLID